MEIISIFEISQLENNFFYLNKTAVFETSQKFRT